MLREAAEEGQEQLLVHGVPEGVAHAHGASPVPQFTPATWVPLLRDLRASARGQGFQGVLVAVLPEASAAAIGGAAHAASEGALGPDPGAGFRIVCFYTRRGRDLLGTDLGQVAASHNVCYRAQEATRWGSS